jgi:hypothetical protein
VGKVILHGGLKNLERRRVQRAAQSMRAKSAQSYRQKAAGGGNA